MRNQFLQKPQIVKFDQFFSVVLFQIHFGSGCALIRIWNDFSGWDPAKSFGSNGIVIHSTVYWCASSSGVHYRIVARSPSCSSALYFSDEYLPPTPPPPQGARPIFELVTYFLACRRNKDFEAIATSALPVRILNLIFFKKYGRTYDIN